MLQRNSPCPGATSTRAKDEGVGLPKHHRPIRIAKKLQALRASTKAFGGPYYFVHAIRLRIIKRLTKQQWKYLRENCEAAFMLRLHDKKHQRDLRWLPFRLNYMKGYLDQPLVVVKPNDKALRFLDALPGVILNYAEFARDQIVPNAEQAHDRFVLHFLHPRHGKHELKIRILNPAKDKPQIYWRGYAQQPTDHSNTGTSYTGQRGRGHLFACYSDLPSKETGEVDCFHLEGRYTGQPALRDQLGINRPADLIDFPHEAYWEKVLQQLYIINFERLGIYDTNCRRGDRRRKPHISDAAVGGALYRVFGTHPVEETNDGDQPQYRSLQQFMDKYKPPARRFLIPFAWEDLIDPGLLRRTPQRPLVRRLIYPNSRPRKWR